METALNSSGDRCPPERNAARQRLRQGNGALLPGVDQRSSWVRRAKELISEHLSDIPDASVAERSILRRAAVLSVECERLEKKFALAGEADTSDLDLYQKLTNTLRRALESVGLQRRARDVSQSLADILNEPPP